MTVKVERAVWKVLFWLHYSERRELCFKQLILRNISVCPINGSTSFHRKYNDRFLVPETRTVFSKIFPSDSFFVYPVSYGSSFQKDDSLFLHPLSSLLHEAVSDPVEFFESIRIWHTFLLLKSSDLSVFHICISYLLWFTKLKQAKWLRKGKVVQKPENHAPPWGILIGWHHGEIRAVRVQSNCQTTLTYLSLWNLQPSLQAWGLAGESTHRLEYSILITVVQKIKLQKKAGKVQPKESRNPDCGFLCT